MDFNIKEFEETVKDLIEKTNKPYIIVCCPSSIIDTLKEQWNEEIAIARFVPCDYGEDKIFVIPTEELEKSIKFVIEKN